MTIADRLNATRKDLIAAETQLTDGLLDYIQASVRMAILERELEQATDKFHPPTD
jgi:hypothetical protein